ncbi:hypothetical protein ACFYO0_14635 [Streptomyces sp. NPDC006365]|uniref:hypothetical protein n=1 Tax=Streptomyces sp. NPDC006365 TaxID=3364744 RepID=UPI00369B923E
MKVNVRGELLIGGVWTDVTGDILKRQLLKHTRGRPDQGARTDPSTAGPLFNNTNGQFSPDNPLSPYYGQFGRNTNFRVTVAVGSPALELPGRSTDFASTPDTAVLDITADLDIRIDATLTPWTGRSTMREVAGKYESTTNQRSWLLLVNTDDRLVFRWSTDGVDVLARQSTQPAPVPASRRLAVRATLDINNGAGGHEVRFYTAPTMAGPWTQLGDLVTRPGVTSVFNSTAPVVVGNISTLGFEGPVGRVHALELRTGIDGTVVARPDFTAQTIGAASFVDSVGRTWTMNGGAAISNRRTRLSHEVAEYPTRWHSSGKHVWVEAQTAGILRRIGRNNQALESTLRRRIPSFNPLAYWPMEDGESAVQAYSPIAGVAPLKLTRANWAQVDSLPSSDALPALASSGSNLPMMNGKIPAAAGTLTGWRVEYVYRLDTPPSALRTFMRIISTGTVAEWYIQQADGSIGSRILGRDNDGNTVIDQGLATGNDLFGQWVRTEFKMTQNGGNVEWRIDWIDVGGEAGGRGGTYAGRIGRPTAVASPSDGYSPLLDGMALGHISAWPTTLTDAYEGAIDAWTGETAGARMRRLAGEENLPVFITGNVAEQTRVGAQRPDAILSLLEEAADADGGILYEDRERAALRYRDRASMYNQAPALTLDYEAPGLATPLEPTGDDDATANDVEVQRTNGSRGRAVLEEGPLSIQAPPNGVGRYPKPFQRSLHSDAQAEPIAYWLMHLGTYEGRRYPQVRVMVHKAGPALLEQILAVDVGDKIVIKNPPFWLAPGDIELIVQGYEETFDEHAWDIIFNCSPGAPWTVGVYDRDHRDTAGSQLVGAVGADDKTISVLTTKGPRWTWANPPLNSNPDFETGLDGWGALGGIIDRVPAPQPAPFNGEWSLKFTPDGVAQFPNGGTTQMAVTVGQQYVASGWLRCAVTRGVALNVNWFGPGGTYLDTSPNDQPVTAGVWRWFEKTVTAPAGSVTANVAATVANFPPATDVLWAHQVTLRPAGGSPADFPFRIQAGGEEIAVTSVIPAVRDTFTRNTAGGWGTSDTGQAWASTGGAPGDHYTQGSEAAHLLTGVDVPRLDLMTVGSADIDVQVDVATGALAAGGPQLVALVGRAIDGDNLYMAQLAVSTSGSIVLSIRKRVAGTESQLAAFTTGLAHAVFAFYRVRLQIVGTRVQARVWMASGAEPPVWQVSATDDSLNSGLLAGCRSVRQTANTNANLLVSYDNFQVLNPQRFTGKRSANGIVKPHPPGTGVRLAQPTVRAL